MWSKLRKYWYFVLIGCFFVTAAAMYLICGEKSYLAVHDNLDLFVAQFQMLKNTNGFFSHGEVPFLGGVSRDGLPSEFSLYTVLYMILPSFWAYIAGYFIKIVIAIVSVWLLAKEWYKEQFSAYQSLTVLLGFAYGCLNMFPAFGIPFASIPLVVYLLLRIYRKPGKWLYLALFCYPFVSYFSYFGLFILAYLTVALVWLSIRDKKLALPLACALFVLSAGYMAFEYRLFSLMLFSDVATIRETIVNADLGAADIARETWNVFKSGMFHAESVQEKLVLPVCLLYFVCLNAGYLVKRQGKAIFHDVYNLLMLVLVFNSLIYGFYFWGGFRTLIETLLPPLKGWQFNRTIFFNPFVWYAAFFIILQRLYARKDKRLMAGTIVLALAAVFVVLRTPVRYNDLFYTFKYHALSYFKGKQTDVMNYEEFYSAALFDQIKEKIGYQGEWAAAYGMHPAVLQYNGIATLDGYLGFYPQSYKDEFRKMIAPAIERVEASRIYYDEWGARAYLYSGTDLSVVSATKNVNVTDYDLYIDPEAFDALGGTYLFSRIAFTNAKEAGFVLIESFQSEESPYEVFVYERTRESNQ